MLNQVCWTVVLSGSTGVNPLVKMYSVSAVANVTVSSSRFLRYTIAETESRSAEKALVYVQQLPSTTVVIFSIFKFNIYNFCAEFQTSTGDLNYHLLSSEYELKKWCVHHK